MQDRSDLICKICYAIADGINLNSQEMFVIIDSLMITAEAVPMRN